MAFGRPIPNLKRNNMAHCNGCNTDKAISVLTYTVKDENNKPIKDSKGYSIIAERCNECSKLSLAPSRPRDAAGDVVRWDEPRYSVAAGKVIHNASEMAEFCREKGYVQTPDRPDLPEQPS